MKKLLRHSLQTDCGGVKGEHIFTSLQTTTQQHQPGSTNKACVCLVVRSNKLCSNAAGSTDETDGELPDPGRGSRSKTHNAQPAHYIDQNKNNNVDTQN
jgi:hypothetical protein